MIGNSLTVSHNRALLVEPADRRWSVQESESGAARLVLVASAETRGMELRVVPRGTESSNATVAHQAWIQTWLVEDQRRDRAVFRVRTSEPQVRIILPRDEAHTAHGIRVATDGREVPFEGPDPQGIVTCPVPAAPPASPITPATALEPLSEHVVEIWYTIAQPSRGTGRRVWSAPEIDAVDHVERSYWQLILPRGEVLLAGDRSWMMEWAWQWGGYGWRRGLLREQADLEQWVGASTQALIPASTNQYVFTAFGLPHRLAATTSSRALLLLAGSGSVLAAGLLLTYLPVPWHPAVLLGLSSVLLTLGLFFPEPATLMAQFAVVGLCLVLLGRTLHTRLRRNGGADGAGHHPVSESKVFETRYPRRWKLTRRNRFRSPCRAGLRGGVRRMMKMMCKVVTWVLCGVLLLWVPGPRLTEAEPPSSSASSAADTVGELRFRRVYVPQGAIADFTRSYMVMKREEFDRFLDRLGDSDRLPPAHESWIRSAEYQAAFSDGELVSGSASLNIEHPSVAPAPLSLAPCGLAIGAATWHRQDTVLGATVGTNSTGGLVVVVPASGQLRFPWSLRGETDLWGETRFELILPQAPFNRFVLDLPEGVELRSDRGLISGPEAPAESEQNPPAGSRSRRRWTIELGGVNRFHLMISPGHTDERRHRVHARLDTRYQLADDAIEVECELELDAQARPVTSATFLVDAELQVTAVQWRERDLAWSVTADENERRRRLTVQFPEPLSAVGSTLRVEAVGPLSTNTAWTLPRVLPHEALWRHGTMTLRVPETLELQHLTMRNGRQVEANNGAAGKGVESARFELFGPDGALELVVARSPHEIEADVGTTIDLESGTITASTVADLTCSNGERFVLEADVPDAWTIDGIESRPANAIEQQVVSSGPDAARLRIQLSTPVAADQPLRLIVRSRRPLSLALRESDWRPIELHDVTRGARLVAVAPHASYRLDLEGDEELTRWDPDRLAPPDADRIQAPAGSLVFTDDRHADRLAIRLTREDPAFAAAIHVDAEFARGTVTERYRIVCTPDAAPVGRLMIHFSEPGDLPLDWTVSEEPAVPGQVRRVPDDQATRPRLGRAGEIWEVVLRTPQDRPFEIRAERVTPFDQARTVSLATLPAATSQDGWLTVRSRDGTPLRIKAHSLKAIPCETADGDDIPAPRARFRFDPSQSAQVTVDRGHDPLSPASLWAWSCVLTSQYLANDTASHRAVYLIESAGGSEFPLRLPLGCDLLGLEIDGRDASRSVRAVGDQVYAVTLPPGKRFPRVQVRFTSTGDRLRNANPLIAHFPEVGFPGTRPPMVGLAPPGLRAARIRAERVAREPSRVLIAAAAAGCRGGMRRTARFVCSPRPIGRRCEAAISTSNTPPPALTSSCNCSVKRFWTSAPARTNRESNGVRCWPGTSNGRNTGSSTPTCGSMPRCWLKKVSA